MIGAVGQVFEKPGGGVYLVLEVVPDGWAPGEDILRCLSLEADPYLMEDAGEVVDNIGSWVAERCVRLA